MARPRGALRRLYRPEDLILRPATRDDDPFLYELLTERYARDGINLAGRARADLPGYEEHVRHLDGEPYERIEIIVADGRRMGMVYLRHDRVFGCFVLRECAARGVGISACYEFLGTCGMPVHAIIHPRNRPSRRTAERLGFRIASESPEEVRYELRRAPTDPFAVGRSSEPEPRPDGPDGDERRDG